jgi:fatty-acyl-CoA synthase
VVGVPDEKWGETGMAFVVPSDAALAAEDIARYCDGAMARFKVPKYVRLVDVLPKGDSGKVLKRELRELGRAELSALAVSRQQQERSAWQ